MTLDLGGAKAKIEHAYSHLQGLQDQGNLFMQTRPYGLRADSDDEGRRHTAYLDIYHGPDLSAFALRIGDVAHNLRSALDYLVYAVAAEQGGPVVVKKHERDLAFPICLSETSWMDAVKRNRLAGVSDSVRAEIQRRQPYVTHNPPETAELAVLKRINDFDKHRLPQPVVAYVLAGGVTFSHHVPAGTWMDTAPGPFDDGAKVVEIILTDPEPDMQMKVDLAVQIQLVDSPKPMGAFNFLEWISQYIQRTMWVIERMV